jgi:phosphate transport system ATP-binding protein
VRETIRLKDISLYYGESPVLLDADLSIYENRITCVIGPSGSGKSTLLRTLNRMNDLVPAFRCAGTVLIEGRDIYHDGVDVTDLRRNVGMVFQKPCIFPKSIYENALFGLRHTANKKKAEMAMVVEETLRGVSLWNDVKDRLFHPAIELSQGQQQRLCLARALAVRPRILLMDEPTSSLDYKSTEAIENLTKQLKENMTVVMVTHKLEQVRRIADEIIYLSNGKVCESGPAEQILKMPQKLEISSYTDNGNLSGINMAEKVGPQGD